MNKFLCRLGHTVRILSVAVSIYRHEGRKKAVSFLIEKFRR